MSTVTLTWSPAATVRAAYEVYKVFRATGSGDFVLLHTEEVEWEGMKEYDIVPPITYDDTTAALGQTYRYKIVAYDHYNRQIASNVYTIITEQPTAPVLSGITDEFDNELSWTAGTIISSTIDSYLLYRSVDSGDFELYQTLDADVLSFNDTDLDPADYSYYVVAHAANGVDSLDSNEVDLEVEEPVLGSLVAVAVNGSTDRAQTSSDASTWVAQTTVANNWQSVCYSPQLNRLVAVGSSGTNRVMTSDDLGVTWINRACPSSTWTSVAWSPTLNLFAAVSSIGATRLMTSPDGITWTTRTAGANTLSICWSPELAIFCAVGSSFFLTSPDGITWTSRAIPAFNTWNGVCWSPQLSLFVTVSTNGTNRVMTSPDGTTWIERATPANITFFDVCWSPGLALFVAVGQKAGGSDAIGVATSPDGITWTARTSTDIYPWSSVCWAPELGLLVAVGGETASSVGRIMTSTNGIAWVARTPAVATSNLTSVTWAVAA